MRVCPKCGSNDLWETTLGWLGKPEDNPNSAGCWCGWKGKSAGLELVTIGLEEQMISDTQWAKDGYPLSEGDSLPYQPQ